MLQPNKDYEMGYLSALRKLEARILNEPDLTTAGVLTHIQDLLRRCKVCGSWIYSDGSCFTCEHYSRVVLEYVEQAEKTTPKPTPKKRARKSV